VNKDVKRTYPVIHYAAPQRFLANQPATPFRPATSAFFCWQQRLRQSQKLIQPRRQRQMPTHRHIPLEIINPLDFTGPHQINLETGMERDEDGFVLGSTRLPGSQRLHQ